MAARRTRVAKADRMGTAYEVDGERYKDTGCLDGKYTLCSECPLLECRYVKRRSQYADKREEAARLLKEGLPLEVVAKKVGYSMRTIQRIVAEGLDLSIGQGKKDHAHNQTVQKNPIGQLRHLPVAMQIVFCPKPPVSLRQFHWMDSNP